jgi:hypothetical protein
VSWSKVSQLGVNSRTASAANTKTLVPFLNVTPSFAQRIIPDSPLAVFPAKIFL